MSDYEKWARPKLTAKSNSEEENLTGDGLQPECQAWGEEKDPKMYRGWKNSP